MFNSGIYKFKRANSIVHDIKFKQLKLDRYNFDIFISRFSSLIKLQNINIIIKYYIIIKKIITY